MRAHGAAALLLLALSAPPAPCRGDADPDADPGRAPRLRPRPPPAVAVSAPDTANGPADAQFDDYGAPVLSVTLLPVVAPRVLIQTLGCRGGSTMAFSIDASSSIVPVEFAEMQSALAQFIIETDDPTAQNRNLYYANTFGTILEDTTAAVAPGDPDFDPNADGAVSDAVREFTPRKGAANIAAGLDDLAAQFAELTDPAYAGVAVLITDSSAQPAPPVAAAAAALKAATRARLGTDVTVIAVGVGGFVDVEELRGIASVDGDGNALVAEVDFFDDIGVALEDMLLGLDSDGDGVDDCRDGCPADPLKTDPGRCGCGVSEEECPSECRGLFGFSLATSACFGSDAFGVVVDEVAAFVNSTSGFANGAANPNLYYANAVNHRVHASTGVFDRNTAGDIAAAVPLDLAFVPGGVNIAAGLDDLRSRFSAGQLPRATTARIAVIVTDGYDDPARVVTAADALKEDGVVVVVVAPAGANDRRNLDSIASMPELVLEVDGYEGLAVLLLSTVAQIDSDGDGTPDCEDACPTDANKVVPGRCGCSEEETTPCP